MKSTYEYKWVVRQSDIRFAEDLTRFGKQGFKVIPETFRSTMGNSGVMMEKVNPC